MNILVPYQELQALLFYENRCYYVYLKIISSIFFADYEVTTQIRLSPRLLHPPPGIPHTFQDEREGQSVRPLRQ